MRSTSRTTLQEAKEKIDWEFVEATLSQPGAVKIKRFDPRDQFRIITSESPLRSDENLPNNFVLIQDPVPQSDVSVTREVIIWRFGKTPLMKAMRFTPDDEKFLHEYEFFGKHIDEIRYFVVLLFKRMVGDLDHSILKMVDSNKKDIFVLDGSKDEVVGKGAFATVTDALPFQKDFEGPVVIRSTSEDVDVSSHDILKAAKLDGVLARADRKKYTTSSVQDRSYTLQYRGVSLFKYLRKHELDKPTALWIAIRSLKAIQKFHQHGVAHRDVKPDNFLVMMDSNGKITEIRLIDFGLSVLMSSDQYVRGTWAYFPVVLCNDQALLDAFAAKRLLKYPWEHTQLFEKTDGACLKTVLGRKELAWIFSDALLSDMSKAFQSIANTSENDAVIPEHTIDFLLSAVLLEQSECLQFFYNKNNDTATIPQEIIDEVLADNKNSTDSDKLSDIFVRNLQNKFTPSVANNANRFPYAGHAERAIPSEESCCRIQ